MPAFAGMTFEGATALSLEQPRRRPAIDRDRGTLDVPGFLAGEKHSEVRDILRLADAAGAAFDDRFLSHLRRRFSLRLAELLEQGDDTIGLDHARVNDIDVDVVAVAHRGDALGEIGKGGIDRAADQEIRSGRARRAADDV